MAGDAGRWRARGPDHGRGTPSGQVSGLGPNGAPHAPQPALSLDTPRTAEALRDRDAARRVVGRRDLGGGQRQLATGDLSARGILRRFQVELVGTTDDPADPLDWHEQIAAAGLATRVVPTFRPDAALKVTQPDRVQAWARRLSDTAGVAADSFAGLLRGLERRHARFAAAGCRATDHGLEYLPDADCTDSEAAAIWERALAGTPATKLEAERFAVRIMLHVGAAQSRGRLGDAAAPGPVPRPQPPARPTARRRRRLRHDRRRPPGPGLVRFLATLAAEETLGRTILYNINPADNALFAALPGSFQDGATPGKIQWGSGWWFLDQERGMREQLNMLSDMGLLSRFVGMVTDSRSFLSYPRHEYFRRILCDLVGGDVASGRLPDRQDWLDALVIAVCSGNARAALGLGAAAG